MYFVSLEFIHRNVRDPNISRSILSTSWMPRKGRQLCTETNQGMQRSTYHRHSKKKGQRNRETGIGVQGRKRGAGLVGLADEAEGVDEAADVAGEREEDARPELARAPVRLDPHRRRLQHHHTSATGGQKGGEWEADGADDGAADHGAVVPAAVAVPLAVAPAVPPHPRPPPLHLATAKLAF